MTLVLAHLAESGSTVSGEVAESLGISPKHAGMTLLRCYRCGFVSRQPYRRGRVRGYIYELTNKGAEWMLYKASQRKRNRQRERIPTTEFTKESINPGALEILILKPDERWSKGYMPILAGLTMLTMQQKINDLVRENQALKDQSFLAIILLAKRSSEVDMLSYLYWNLKEKFELLEKSRHRESLSSFDSDLGGWCEGRESGIELGKKIGIAFGESRQQRRTQAMINNIFRKKKLANFKKAQNSRTSVSKLVQLRSKELLRKFSPDSNDWWNSLPAGSGSSLPCWIL
ncbi:MAG: hypothetical protein JSW14_00050 [Candidatus Bathyarchaeum sp.]|nr:MAG: hypothetical protein JSW14_00050 [Candidatus Bathyarchaeum sp.]